MNNKIKAIIFDFGGVYFTPGSVKEVLTNFVKKTKLSKKTVISILLSRSKLKELDKKVHDFNLNKINENELWDYVRNITGLKKKNKELTKIILSDHKPIKDVQNIVKKLRKKYKVVLLTNNNIWLDILNKKYGFYKIFYEVISSHDVELAKPDVRIYKLMLRKLNLKPSECVFVDDKKKNVESAIKIGMNGIIFKNPKQLRISLEKIGVFI